MVSLSPDTHHGNLWDAGYSVMAPTFRRKKTSTVYFVAEFNKPFDTFSGWRSKPTENNENTKTLISPVMKPLQGPNIGAYVTYKNLKQDEKFLPSRYFFCQY